MIALKTAKELEQMRAAGRISAEALLVAGEHCEPGVSTKDVDNAVRKYILSQGAKPSFLHYNGFPASACISVNDTVIHGIPSKNEILKEGDVVSVDVGAYYQGFHGDNAYTFRVGQVSEEADQLLRATEQSLYEAIKLAVPGNRIGDLGHAVEQYVSQYGYGVIREYVGHGVGRELHESPEVPNYGKPGHGVRLVPGMVIAIEPMINLKGDRVKVLSDGWTVKTVSGSLSAHFEHTIAITKDVPIILTKARQVAKCK